MIKKRKPWIFLPGDFVKIVGSDEVHVVFKELHYGYPVYSWKKCPMSMNYLIQEISKPNPPNKAFAKISVNQDIFYRITTDLKTELMDKCKKTKKDLKLLLKNWKREEKQTEQLIKEAADQKDFLEAEKQSNYLHVIEIIIRELTHIIQGEEISKIL